MASLGGIQKNAMVLGSTGLTLAIIALALLTVQGSDAITVDSAAYNVIGTTVTAFLTMAGFFGVLAIGVVVKPVVGMFRSLK